MLPYLDSFILLYTDYFRSVHNKTNPISTKSLSTKFCSALKISRNDSVCLPSCWDWLLSPLSRHSGQDSRKTPPHFSMQKLAHNCLQALCTLALHRSALKHSGPGDHMGSRRSSEGPTAALSSAPPGFRGPCLFPPWISTSIKTPKKYRGQQG